MKRVIAVFDFDGTLRKGESGLEFVYFFLGFRKAVLFFLKNMLKVLAYIFKINDENNLKELVYSLLNNRNIEQINLAAEQFAEIIIPKKMNRNILARLFWHQAQHHTCLIVSRSLKFYLEPWARKIDVGVIATEAEVVNQIFTGRLVGVSCNGVEKARQLLSRFSLREKYIIYAYGDSQGDKEMLKLADFSYLCANDSFKLISEEYK